MKQIDIIKTYSQKRCLIVEDNADVRAGLKRILVDFGATQVDMAGNAEEAIETSSINDYDIVLADYNLGKGRNGQQLLEELRLQRLLKNASIFIMITAESAVQHVILALDHQPDDYLSKPINKESLRPRLDAALLKNEALIEIKNAMDMRRPLSAIQACRDVIAIKNRYVNEAKRILGKLLCNQELYDEAVALYEAFDAVQRPLWVELGLATAYIGTKQLDKALALLNSVIEKHQYCAEAFDLLATLYQEKKKHDLAQEALSSAVNLSPISVTRQRALGEVSLETGDKQAAAHAFRATIKLSKNSSQGKADDFINLAQVLLDTLEKDEKQAPTLASEALDVLKQVDKKYGKQPIIQLRKHLLKADILSARRKEADSKIENTLAMEVFEKIRFSVVENTSSQLCVDCAKSLMARGKYDEGEKLLLELAKFNQDKSFAIKIDKLLREPLTKEGIAYAAKLNKEGIRFYSNNQYQEAYDAFCRVLEELPNHVGLNLNFIQTLISKSKESPLSEHELAQIANSFQRLGEIDTESPNRKRFDYLVKHYDKLCQTNAHSDKDAS